MCCRCVIIIALLSQTWKLSNPRESICAARHENVEGRSLRWAAYGLIFTPGSVISSYDLVVRGWRRLIQRCRRRRRRYQNSDVIRWRRWILSHRWHRRRRSADYALADAGRVRQGDNVILLHTDAVLRPTAMMMMVMTVTMAPAEDRVQACRQQQYQQPAKYEYFQSRSLWRASDKLKKEANRERRKIGV